MVISFWISYFEWPFFPSTVHWAPVIDDESSTDMCGTWEASFLFRPWITLTPILQNLYISPNPLAKKYSCLTFPLCFCHVVGICNTFVCKILWIASQCLLFPYVWGAARWCVWRSFFDPRLGAWLSPLGVTINYTHIRSLGQESLVSLKRWWAIVITWICLKRVTQILHICV